LIGKKISHYSVAAKIGEGGMGEVYRASDTRLDRDVALKVLRQDFVSDEERMARFQREAQVLASLNHPNIATIHGFEEAEGVRCLVLEFIEGPALNEMIAQGPLPLEEALDIARQVADALEAAHERGIVHRDLKPGNIKVTPTGTVKVLDFGIAKALRSHMYEGDTASSPTLTAGATYGGVIPGTPSYMSPEQARGVRVDRRSDIWAFGVVLFEMLSGERLYAGDTASDVLASIIKDEPPWDRLPTDTPPQILRLLSRCLTKDPKRRLQAIGEARIAIEDYSSGAGEAVASATAEAPESQWQRASRWMAGALAIALAASLFGLWRATRPAERSPVHLNVVLSAEDPIWTEMGAAAVLSPDGQRLAFVAGTGPDRRLYLRSLDQAEADPLPDSEGARNPFFSPDGEWLAFFTNNTLKKVSVFGGAPITLYETQNNRGGAWGSDGTIVFANHTTVGLSQISAKGGEPKPLTTRGAESGSSHRFPQFLPGGEVVLYSARIGSQSFDDGTIEVVNLKTGESRVLHRGGYYPRYLPTGHLVFVREGTLFAVPFDLDRLEITGRPVPVLEEVLSNPGNGGAHLDVSRDGTLVYLGGTSVAEMHAAVWVDQEGNVTTLLEESRDYGHPRFSPDGSRLSLNVPRSGGLSDVWVYEFRRRILTRLTLGDGNDFGAIWSPTGRRVLFSSDRHGGQPNLYWKRADGSGEAERLTTSPNFQVPTSWSPDEKRVAYMEISPETNSDLWLLPIEAGAEPVEFLRTEFYEGYPAFSPDGRWLAYISNESGEFELYVRAFPGPGGRWQISNGGAKRQLPVWSRDGGEIFYRAGNRMMAVGVVSEGGSFRAGLPRALFEKTFVDLGPVPDFTLAPDGRRFVLFQREDQEGGGPPHTHVSMVINWFEELERLAPATQ
jgi:serine/threonine-protein kinase